MSTMPGTVIEKPFLSGAEPVLYVRDFARSLDFFTDKLGFAADFTYGEPPFYGVVQRDKARLCLRQVDGPVFAGDIRQRDELLSASITLDSGAAIDRLYRDYQAAGVGFHQPLTMQSWGAWNFIVLDPDGNLILFAAPNS
ncbi:VOC family protein [Pararhizobium sp.]|uniref:VOC family protein n=1 Tax=Pararhizobium sp. TaxID=1977563 RepID=UPI002D80F7FB|nr:VOC family protein [Pararhizobium sp.]